MCEDGSVFVYIDYKISNIHTVKINSNLKICIISSLFWFKVLHLPSYNFIQQLKCSGNNYLPIKEFQSDLFSWATIPSDKITLYILMENYTVNLESVIVRCLMITAWESLETFLFIFICELF